MVEVIVFQSHSLSGILITVVTNARRPGPVDVNAGLLPRDPVFQEDLSVAGTAQTVCPMSSEVSEGGGGMAVMKEGPVALPVPLGVPSAADSYDARLAPTASDPLPVDTVARFAAVIVPSRDRTPEWLGIVAGAVTVVPAGRKVTMCFPMEVQSVTALHLYSQLSTNFAAIFSRDFSVGLGHVFTETTSQSEPPSFSVAYADPSEAFFSPSNGTEHFSVERSFSAVFMTTGHAKDPTFFT